MTCPARPSEALTVQRVAPCAATFETGTPVTTAAPSPAPETTRMRPPAELHVIRGLFVLLAFVSIVGSFLFAWPMGGLSGIATGLALDVAGVLFLVAAVKLPSGERWVANLARWLAGLEVAWSFYKVVIYNETESTGFLVAAVLATLLLWSPRVRRFFSEAAR